MKNADKPIYPIKGVDDLYYNEKDEPYIKQVKPFLGLTKREYFAGLALQGLISSFTEKASYGGWGTEMEATIKCAIDYADELLKQLENEN